MDDLAYRACLQHCAHVAASLETLDLDAVLAAAQTRGNAGDIVLINRLIRARGGMTPLRITPAMLRSSIQSWRGALATALTEDDARKEIAHTIGGMDQVLEVLNLIHKGN